MIRMENMSVVFSPGTPDENRALRGINLRVENGDFVTIIGSNGAGKTTLYNAISGAVPAVEGRIFMRSRGEDGGNPEREITKEAEYRRARYIGRIFQDPLKGTAGNMSLQDNMVICRTKGYKGLKISLNRRLREEFRAQLRKLGMGLENRLQDNVELFSGGQRQALTLLMAVISGPGLLLLDEHTAALDPHNAEMVMNLTVQFASEYRLTVMMITHNMNQAIRYGNRLLIMDSGEIIQDIGAEEKARLHVQDIVERFRKIRKHGLENDELLLS